MIFGTSSNVLYREVCYSVPITEGPLLKVPLACIHVVGTEVISYGDLTLVWSVCV